MTNPIDFFKEVYGAVPDWVEKMNKYSSNSLQHYFNLRNNILVEGHLSRKEKELILVGINAARRYERSMIYHTKGALDAGATVVELSEILTTCIISRGIPAWLEGMKAIQYAEAYLQKSSDQSVGNNAVVELQNAEDALVYYQEAMGAVPKWANLLNTYEPNVLVAYSNLRKEVLRDGSLSRKTKELLLIGINVSERYKEGTRIHVEGARKLGATDEEIAEVTLTALLTAGIPAWFEGSDFLE